MTLSSIPHEQDRWIGKHVSPHQWNRLSEDEQVAFMSLIGDIINEVAGNYGEVNRQDRLLMQQDYKTIAKSYPDCTESDYLKFTLYSTSKFLRALIAS